MGAWFLILAVANNLALAQAPTNQGLVAYDTCCFCVTADKDEKHMAPTIPECKTWLKAAKDREHCSFRQMLTLTEATELEFTTPDKTCTRSVIYGAFHGTSIQTKIPFELAQGVADSFKSKEVCYDGSSCHLFDNIDDIPRFASSLAENRDRKFRISANQNVGVAKACLFSGRKEVSSMASKLTVIIEDATVRLEYAECSKAGKVCARAIRYTGSKNDPNTKSCLDDGVVVEQSCCSHDDTDLTGKWSVPGEHCLK